MAGSSQASNLTGMLGNLANSVGRMGEAGLPYVDTFRRLQAPDVDMNDSASLLNYADYARRNGYDDEAKQYMALALRQKETEKAEAKDARRATVLADGAESVVSSKGLGAKGDVRALNLNMDKLKAQLQAAKNSKDSGLVQSITQQMATVASEIPGAMTVKAKKGAAAIDTYQAMLDEMPADDPRREGLQKALDYLKSNPDVQAAYRTLQKEEMSVQAAELGITRAEQAIEESDYERSRREQEEKLEALRLDNAYNTAVAQRAAAQDRANETQGKTYAGSLASRGIYDPSKLPKDLDPSVRTHAVEYLNKERQAQEQSNSMAQGKLTPFYDSTARGLAYEDDGVTVKNAPLAALITEYDRVHSQDTLNPGEATRITGLIANAVKGSQEKALAGVGDTKYQAAGQLSAFRDLPNTDGLFEGSTYKTALEDETAFNEMRNGLATYMTENGITEFKTVTELYNAMDAVAPTLANSDVWKGVTNQNERIRDQAKQDFDRQFAASQSAYAEQYSAAQIEAIPEWKNYPEELKSAAADQFQTEVDNVNGFFDPTPLGAGMRGAGAMSPQQRMIQGNSDEWASVVEMVGEVWAGKIEARVMAGLPVRWETFDWDEDGK
jgi:hypothetical protein